jgi:hypothetical protein
MPGKHSDTRIKPLPLANGHGRYITAKPERAFFSVGEWPLHVTDRHGFICTAVTAESNQAKTRDFIPA